MSVHVDQPINPYRVNDPLVAILNEQIAEETRNPTTIPERVAAVSASRKYLFRTRPGTVRKLKIRIPMLPDSVRNIDDPTRGRRNYGQEFAEKYAKMYSAEQRDVFAELVDRIGDVYIEFTEVARKHQCFYETDDPMIADFIRSVIAGGKVPHLYEDTGGQWVRSRYTEDLFPQTPDGLHQLYIHDLAYEKALASVQQQTAPQPEPAQVTTHDLEAFFGADVGLIQELLAKHVAEQQAEGAKLDAELQDVESVGTNPPPTVTAEVTEKPKPPARSRSTTARKPRGSSKR